MKAAREKRSRERRYSPMRKAPGGPGLMEEERDLMLRIREACGDEIEEATGGDEPRSALLAAITANESGGSGRAYRFEPLVYYRLHCLLKGEEKEVEGISRPQLENFLNGAQSEAERTAALKKVAARHGYTQIPGWWAVLRAEPLEALTQKAQHFRLAVQRLEELSQQFHLDPEQNALELGRAWSTGHPMGRTQSALYSWRLGLRRSLYGNIGTNGGAADRDR